MLGNTYLSLEVAALRPHSPGLVKMRGLEADCELCSQQVVVVARAGRFVLKAVLSLELGVRGETVSNRSVDAPQILTPAEAALSPILDGSKNLLIPAQRTEKLGREFIFGFKIICERVRVADPRHLEARFVKFRPYLQVVPGKARILSQNKFAKIANAATTRQCWFGFAPEICAVAH